MKSAIENGKFECFKYCHVNGIKLPFRLPQIVMIKNYTDILNYYNKLKK